MSGCCQTFFELLLLQFFSDFHKYAKKGIDFRNFDFKIFIEFLKFYIRSRAI